MTHELPSALFHFLDGLGIDVADLRVQGDGCFNPRLVEQIGETPQAGLGGEVFRRYPELLGVTCRHMPCNGGGD
jgi:hypothetical protein